MNFLRQQAGWHALAGGGVAGAVGVRLVGFDRARIDNEDIDVARFEDFAQALGQRRAGHLYCRGLALLLLRSITMCTLTLYI